MNAKKKVKKIQNWVEQKNALLTYSGATDIGRMASNNEDVFVVQNLWNKRTVFAAVIDGVGGYEGGEKAAAEAKRVLVDYLEHYSNGERVELLKQAVCEANNAVFALRQLDDTAPNMSCVLTAVIVDEINHQISMAHVGDTRLYCFTNGNLQKLSHDHSLIGYREEVGDLTEEEAMHHPQRNVISRDVGSDKHSPNDTNFIDSATFDLQPDSILLLCSDGLSDMISSAQINEVLKSDNTLDEKVQLLIQAANDAGGKDNIAVALVQYRGVEPASNKKEENAAPQVEYQMGPASEEQEKKRADKKGLIIRFLLVGLFVTLALLTASIFIATRMYRSVNGQLEEKTLQCDSLKKQHQQDSAVLRVVMDQYDSLSTKL